MEYTNPDYKSPTQSIQYSEPSIVASEIQSFVGTSAIDKKVKQYKKHGLKDMFAIA